MNNKNFLNDIKEILEISNREIELSDQFRDLPEWDSLALLSVIAYIDDNYDVLIEGEEFAKLNTILDLIQYIEKSTSN